MNLNEEQAFFNNEIISEVSTIEDYMKVLLEIMNNEKFIKLDKKVIHTKEFIDDIVNTAKSLSSVKKIKLEIDIKELPGLIKVDYVMLKRALINIISNAVDFTPQEEKIGLSVQANDDNLIITIEDNGRGFTEEEIKYAVNQFFQGDKSRNRKNHYGMGLYIAKDFVENHDGRIILTNSESFSGARVIVMLPLKNLA